MEPNYTWGTKMNEKRTLTKISNEKYELKTVDEEHDLTTIKGYKKTELKDIHQELTMRQGQTRMQKAKLEKDLTKLEVQDTPDLREFTEKLVLAQKLAEKDKLTGQMVMVKKDLSLLNTQLTEIILAVPELTRKK